MRLLINIFLLYTIFTSCQKQETISLFESLPSSHTNIHFNNKIIETPAFNILDYLYFYNGGGVATGDLNNDGLPDLFFTSNLGNDQCYFNQGNFKFEEVSDRFPQKDLSGWSTGVTLVDVNQDTWLDIYVCKLGNYGPYNNHNKLFINNKGKSFTEAAQKYSLDFSGFGTQAAFFDYDQDGDLDCYLLNHSVKNSDQFRPSKIRHTKDSLAGDLLLENIDGRYKDVTSKAGIYSSSVGFGLGIDIADVNDDGWLDIYIGNDFHENDYLYINQQNKSFKEVISEATGHTSNFSMGCAIADINNDSRPDILSLDMKPFDEKIYKKSGGWESLEIYNYKRSFGYHHQSPRNALQINRGLKNNIPFFSEQAAYYGLEATDWSWSPLLFDFDNDGDKDIYITNGIVRRPNDMDFVKFYFDLRDPNKINQIQKIPKGDIANCYFENQGDKNSFSKKGDFPATISTGAAVADFDQDGLIDIVINNINAPATILKNINNNPNVHFLRIKLIGESNNYFGLGASIVLYQGNNIQLAHIKSSSGFQSFNEPIAHFGLMNTSVDSLKIIWPDGFVQIEKIGSVDQVYTFKKGGGRRIDSIKQARTRTSQNIVNYLHQENNYNDQQSNKWLLYNQSTFGPRMTLLDDKTIYVTGNQISYSGLVNTENLDFTPFENTRHLIDENSACIIENQSKQSKFIYSSKGGNERKNSHHTLQDEIFKIDSNNTLEQIETNFPKSNSNNSICINNDFDKDGDQDIFVGVHSDPSRYGSAENSYLLVNQNNVFTKQELPISGMVYDAKWEDMDNNGYKDLIVVGHWMQISILYNNGKDFEKKEITESSGLWFSVFIEDLNGDGLKDIIAGNYGTNHSLKVNATNPLRFYQNDYDKNGTFETLVTYVANGIESPYPNQELFAAQIPGIKKNYLKNVDYANAKITDLISDKLLNTALKKEVVTLESTYFIQEENKTWKQQKLSTSLQVAPIFAIEKMNSNTFFFGGNFHEIDPNWGRQDASYLSAFRYTKQQWQDVSNEIRLPLIKGAIRDLLFKSDKLYVTLNNGPLKVIHFNDE